MENEIQVLLNNMIYLITQLQNSFQKVFKASSTTKLSEWHKIKSIINCTREEFNIKQTKFEAETKNEKNGNRNMIDDWSYIPPGCKLRHKMYLPLKSSGRTCAVHTHNYIKNSKCITYTYVSNYQHSTCKWDVNFVAKIWIFQPLVSDIPGVRWYLIFVMRAPYWFRFPLALTVFVCWSAASRGEGDRSIGKVNICILMWLCESFESGGEGVGRHW